MNTALTVAVLVLAAAIALFAIARAVRDDQRGWAIGITVLTVVFAPVGVVLAITYLVTIRRRIGLR